MIRKYENFTSNRRLEWKWPKRISVHSAISALLSLCIDFKNYFGQITSGWVLWKTYYTLLLKKCLRPCPGPSMYLTEKINWIISSFPHRISKILFVLGSWDDFGSLWCRIGECSFFYDSILSLGSVWRHSAGGRALLVKPKRSHLTLWEKH